ncbi:MAG: helix-turn-helix domain-containing protein [Fibrobacter sp.]|nr:helix-turn-helix domain-containing protein [Fibrobacter sp.]
MNVESAIRDIQKKLQTVARLTEEIKQTANDVLKAPDYDWVTVKTASDKLSVSVATIYKMVNNSEIPVRRISGRIMVNISKWNSHVRNE